MNLPVRPSTTIIQAGDETAYAKRSSPFTHIKVVHSSTQILLIKAHEIANLDLNPPILKFLQLYTSSLGINDEIFEQPVVT